MPWKTEFFNIQNKQINAAYWNFIDSNTPVFIVCGTSAEPFLPKLRKTFTGSEKSLLLIFFDTTDWDADFSVFPYYLETDHRQFKGNAPKTLDFICNELIPELKKRYFIPLEPRLSYLCGYSLAGSFALWASLNSNCFGGAVCCSGSFWIPGTLELLQAEYPARNLHCYISLGKREHQTSHPFMKNVLKDTQSAVQMLSALSSVGSCSFVLEGGTHFTDPEGRMIRGINDLYEKYLQS